MYPGPPPAAKMEFFATIAFVTKISILGVGTCPGTSYTIYLKQKSAITFNENKAIFQTL